MLSFCSLTFALSLFKYIKLKYCTSQEGHELTALLLSAKNNYRCVHTFLAVQLFAGLLIDYCMYICMECKI